MVCDIWFCAPESSRPDSRTSCKRAAPDDLTQRGQRIHDIIREAFRELNAMKAANEFPLLAQDSDADGGPGWCVWVSAWTRQRQI